MEVKKNILFVPAWAASFFAEQQNLFSQDNHVFQLLHCFERISRKNIYHYISGRRKIYTSHFEGNNLYVKITWINVKSKITNNKLISLFSQQIGDDIVRMIGVKPDLIQIQSVSEISVFVAEWARQNSIPLIVTEHILFVRRSFDFLSRQKENVYSIADRVFCVSNYLYRNLLTSGLQMRSVRVVGNWINDEYILDSSRQRIKNNRILFVASHFNDKNIPLFLSVASLLKSDRKLVDVIGLTGNEYYSKSRTFKEELEFRGLSDMVICRGILPHPQVLALYNEYSVLLSTSTSETFGLAVAEAIAYGTFVVCTDSGGIRDFVNEQNGIVVGINDARELHNAIIKAFDIKCDYEENSKRILNKYGRLAYLSNYSM